MLNVDQLVAQFGAYYIPGGQSVANLKKALYAASETAALFNDRPMMGDYFRGSKVTMGNVLQPFQKAFTPSGDLSFQPNAFPLFKVKIDISLDPDDIESTWAGFLSGMDDADRAAWPIVRYLIEDHAIPKKDDDMELQVSFNGKYVAPTTGVASPVGQTMDGIKAVLNRYNLAGRLNLGNGPLTMGAIATTPADFCTQVEEWVESMDPVLRSQITEVVMSEQLSIRYQKGKLAKYGRDFNLINIDKSVQVDVSRCTIDSYPRISVVGKISHNGSNVIWATPKVNRIRPIWKSTSVASVFQIKSYDRDVHVLTDWWEALDFEVPEFVIVNEQPLS